ncbi:lysophospholipase [Eggerthella lenta]|nr:MULTISPECIES: alpha/beta hydrolase [Eggerthella]MCB6941449.1 alpha/beta hydrolase [Eggerthella lenta]MCQ5138166.1 lysophospholipase [Eggerthella lenta]MDB1766592.1 lysophospholipase [Eggerthella lenta]MDB1770686.1 lysophospholipase [Eggerthella lenta]MDB1772573.1 lysophospholipase [Eggerthella lenta]
MQAALANVPDGKHASSRVGPALFGAGIGRKPFSGAEWDLGLGCQRPRRSHAAPATNRRGTRPPARKRHPAPRRVGPTRGHLPRLPRLLSSSSPALHTRASTRYNSSSLSTREKGTRMQQQLTKQTPEGFLLVGRIDAPEQPKAAAVIVHGLCEHFGRYDYVTQRLLEAGYAVVRFDHRGHGRSMGKKVWYDDRTQIVSDTDLFVEEARAQFPDLPVFMIGHSMGGFGAASYGTAHPGKLDGYVLSGAWTRDHAGLASGAVEQGLDPETYIPNELGDGVCSDPAVGEAYLADPFVIKEFSVALLRAVHDGHLWLRAQAADFADPVLLLHGGDDGLVSPQDSIDMFREASSADKSLRIYAGLYHEIFNEFKKDRVIRDAIEWLDDHVR